MSNWLSPKPTHCNLCRDDLQDFFVDGKTEFGPWAVMCHECHMLFGCGLGLGLGQLYDLNTLVKVKG